jgi:hypothetical protein
MGVSPQLCSAIIYFLLECVSANLRANICDLEQAIESLFAQIVNLIVKFYLTI